ncbi:hypothetical protein GPECTOR_69g413 [Gonium pectorale]|uniref:Uncharacterized protein n=1 Tax=Gonium pectorale TaxID=33097 RepID=A0A150G4T8_GONPE|nr:hypothetical protein GPECTOR_69g413 [Gonium pectorale]|eukprot:KXZ44320.1 hypothetical protein GPECTOR_69g413 [Gonium pectorale]
MSNHTFCRAKPLQRQSCSAAKALAIVQDLLANGTSSLADDVRANLYKVEGDLQVLQGFPEGVPPRTGAASPAATAAKAAAAAPANGVKGQADGKDKASKKDKKRKERKEAGAKPADGHEGKVLGKRKAEEEGTEDGTEKRKKKKQKAKE